MRRREFITLLGGAAATAWPLAAAAQENAIGRRVGVLIPYAEAEKLTEGHLVLFREALQQLGWKDGSNLRMDYRWADADSGRLQKAAEELVQLNPNAILVRSTPATAALLRTTRKLPIVFVVVSDPVGDGFVESIPRPGRNATGFTNVEASLAGKWVELLKEIAPKTKRVGLIYGKRTAAGGGAYYVRLVEGFASSFNLSIIPLPFDDASEAEHNVEDFGSQPYSSLLILPDATTTGHRTQIIHLAARLRLPAVYAFRDFAAEGGLMSYGVDVSDLYKRAAAYVDRILRGESPSDLPVQTPSKFELVINTRAAKEIELAVPPILLTRADEVIE